jgi:pantoate--beta-alanine ligase
MEIFDTPEAMRAWSRAERRAGHTIAVVPTMGALHEGHHALVAEAQQRADRTIVTIFVNPLQFNRAADFDSYPRPLDDDLAVCEQLAVDAVYAPTAAAMYPAGFQTHVVPGDLAERLEGTHRPGHFQGVTTVVAKLFGATSPDVAVFGQKDFQQLAIVRRMTRDLDLGIEIVGVPTVREPDGLALSSRNRLLRPQDRAAATVVWRALRAAAAAYRAGERDAAALRSVAVAVLEAEPRARPEYLEVVDAATLEPQPTVTDEGVILAAVWFGDVRLIDNLRLGEETPPDGPTPVRPG